MGVWVRGCVVWVRVCVCGRGGGGELHCCVPVNKPLTPGGDARRRIDQAALCPSVL